tara:strand:- start:41 stop:574 length:534 start_codon:yes stop_codon:yes gene_type:complete
MGINFATGGTQSYPGNQIKSTTHSLNGSSTAAWESLPDGITNIIVSMEEVSTGNNNVPYYIQIGDTDGSYITSGYEGTWIHENTGGSAGGREQGSGFEIYQSGNNYYSTGLCHLQLHVTGSYHKWVCTILHGQRNSEHVAHGGGFRTLSGSARLDRVRLSCSSGNFDSGSATLHYSF